MSLILSVQDLTMHYTTRKGDVSAVDNVSFDLEKGQSLGLVGESGCGKTSIAFALMRLLPENGLIKDGYIMLDGKDVVAMDYSELLKVRWRKMAMVFQAAMNAFNPVYTIAQQITEALELHLGNISPTQARERITDLFKLVGLEPALMDRYPHEFSGGMRQRAVIAMALSCSPDIIIADEPTTALDVIVQDRILKQIRALQKELNMAMIYISHDIAVIAEVSDRIGVMYAGRMVEMADSRDVFEHPSHPYTYALMGAFPSIKGKRRDLKTLPGEPPDLLNPPPGCRFHPRCPYATDVCREKTPDFQPMDGVTRNDLSHGHYIACWNPLKGVAL
ncbi:MAG TPA: ABC transporter ATP-binding protein [Anaerolineae bacterium]|nr:ABC transporter ATP-binding protein [Anaerolineae bacterium]